MIAPTTEQQLRQLREGDRLKYHGVQWQVKDYSTYTDPNGYETAEWLLRSQTGKEYYLMREIDPQNPQGLVHWYIAEEVQKPTLYEPSSLREVTYTVADEMRSHQTPYPKLQFFNRTYQFESQTEGDYETDGEMLRRITWDYWDPTHLWNLALEAWENGDLVVYSTRTVRPADFTLTNQGSMDGFAAPEIESSRPSGFRPSTPYTNYNSSRNTQRFIAWVITIVGFLLMIAGI